MGHNLLDRLSHESDDKTNYPDIALHSFCSCIREYARKLTDGAGLTKAQINSVYSIGGGDLTGIALIDLISNAVDKIKKADEICDVLIIHEHEQTRSLYPTGASMKTRLGI